jgi:hypothetical protein
MLQVHNFTTGETIKANRNKPDTGKLLVAQLSISANGYLVTRVSSIGGKLTQLHSSFGHLRAGDVVPMSDNLTIQVVQTRTPQYLDQPQRADKDGVLMEIDGLPYYENNVVAPKGTADVLLSASRVAVTTPANAVPVEAGDEA